MHKLQESLSLPAEPDLLASTESTIASHVAADNNAQQQQAALSGEGVSSTAPALSSQLPSRDSASTAAQPACSAAKPSVSHHHHAGIQTNPATALTPVLLTPPATQQLGQSRPAAVTAETKPAVAALSAVAIIPATGQGHAPAEQIMSSQLAMDSTLSEQHQHQTIRDYRSSVSAIDDLSELEVDAEITTGVPAMADGAPAAHPPAPAALQSVSQKRPTFQAPLDLASSTKASSTKPCAKKHKMNDGSANAPTAGRGSVQLAGSAATAQQLTVPHLSNTQCASPHWHVHLAPTSVSSEPPSEVSLSMHTITSTPPHIHSQKAMTVPMTLPKTTETAATRTALPQHPHAAASKLDNNVVKASQQLVLSLPASITSPSAKGAFVTVSCQMLAAGCGAAAQQSSSTEATASASTAVKADIAHALFALSSHSLVTLHPNSGINKSGPVLSSNKSLLPNQASSSYQPTIQELPSDFTAAAPTDLRAAANQVLPSKPGMVIDIDSDDDHTVAANSQQAASLQGRQGQDDKPGQSQGSMARLCSQPAMQSGHASAATRPGQGQACLSAHPPPATEVTPCAASEQATASKMSFDQPPAPMGMGEIFTAFAALENLSDAEEEETGTELAAATSAAAGQLNNPGSAGGEGYTPLISRLCVCFALR